MYELTVERTFCAAHAISVSGQREAVHGHNWVVTATIAGNTLDDDGLLCDFHTVSRVMKEICRPFDSSNLNQTEPFHQLNPTAEHVARYIATEMSNRLDKFLAPHARVSAVRVTESPGCAATFRPQG